MRIVRFAVRFALCHDVKVHPKPCTVVEMPQILNIPEHHTCFFADGGGIPRTRWS